MGFMPLELQRKVNAIAASAGGYTEEAENSSNSRTEKPRDSLGGQLPGVDILRKSVAERI